MISIITAMDKHRLIGANNGLPWDFPEDLKYFRKITTGHAVLMGYNTYLSIYNKLGKGLPNRINYVLTTETEIPGDGIIVSDLEALLNKYKDEELFVIGGRSVYQQFIDIADKLYITRIKGDFTGDTYFPEYDESNFELVSSSGSTSAKDNLVFEVYKRIIGGKKKWIKTI